MEQKNKTEYMRQNAMYYTLLFFLLLFIAGTAILIVPVLAFAKSIIGVLVISILGLSYGLFVTYFIKELDLLTHHHHAGIWAVFLFGSIINFGLITPTIFGLGNYFNIDAHYQMKASIFFAFSFLIPYFLYVYEEMKKNNVERFKNV